MDRNRGLTRNIECENGDVYSIDLCFFNGTWNMEVSKFDANDKKWENYVYQMSDEFKSQYDVERIWIELLDIHDGDSVNTLPYINSIINRIIQCKGHLRGVTKLQF